MKQTVRTSLTVHSKSFIFKVWKYRDKLEVHERFGFSQFFYLTLCAHMEALLVDRIKTRLASIRGIPWNTLPPLSHYKDGDSRKVSYDPATESIDGIVAHLENEVENLQFTKLLELYSRVFKCKVVEILGRDLNQDMKTLSDLRNVYAHGRDLVLDYVGDRNGALSVQDNKIRQAARRLKNSGVIESSAYGGTESYNLIKVFSEDKVLAHFYEATRAAERLLRRHHPFDLEESMEFTPTLPPLKD